MTLIRLQVINMAQDSTLVFLREREREDIFAKHRLSKIKITCTSKLLNIFLIIFRGKKKKLVD